MPYETDGYLVTESKPKSDGDSFNEASDWSDNLKSENLAVMEGKLQLAQTGFTESMENMFFGFTNGEIVRLDLDLNPLGSITGLDGYTEFPVLHHPPTNHIVVGTNAGNKASFYIIDMAEGNESIIDSYAIGPQVIDSALLGNAYGYDSDNDYIVPYDIDDGTAYSESPYGGFSSPASTGLVFAPFNYYSFIGLDNGIIYRLDNLSLDISTQYPNTIRNGLSAYNNGLYFATTANMFYKLDYDLNELWSLDISTYGSLNGNGSIYNGVIYIPAGNYIVAIDVDTGSILWDYQAVGTVDNPPVIYADSVIFTANSTTEYINRIDFNGSEIFSLSLDTTRFGNALVDSGPPFIRSDYIYLIGNYSGEGNLQKRKISDGTRVNNMVVVRSENVYNQSSHGKGQGWNYTNMPGKIGNSELIGGVV